MNKHENPSNNPNPNLYSSSNDSPPEGGTAARSRGNVPRSVSRTLLVVLTALALLAPVAAAAIDAWPRYEPQRTCSPAAKPGTLRLAAWLQKTYPGSGSYGISRACGSGGASEHKEGRAFDWRVNVNNPRERKYANAFISRILRKDKQGNPAALARKMGVMYVIWNDRIWSASRRYAPRAYKNAGCRTVAGCSATLRHRDHVHISLTWAGARAQTSWYGGKPAPKPAPKKPAPKPKPKPKPKPAPALNVSGGRTVKLNVHGNGKVTAPRARVIKGRTYKLTVHGLYRFGRGVQNVADAACVWSPSKGRFHAAADAAVKKSYGQMDLVVNGRKLFGAKCNTNQHTYTARFTPKVTTTLKLKVANKWKGAPNNALRVIVSAPQTNVSKMVPKMARLGAAPKASAARTDGRLALYDHVEVDAKRAGTLTRRVLEKGVTYRVVVVGTASLGKGVLTNGQCLRVGNTWRKHGSLDLRQPVAHHGDLYLDGRRFSTSATPCGSWERSSTFRPSRTGRVNLSVWDPLTRGDNSGDLDVAIYRIDPVPVPAAARAESGSGRNWWDRYENVTVRANAKEGATTRLRFRAGERVHLYASGSYDVGETTADAGCVAQGYHWSDDASPAGQDLYRVVVDGSEVDWQPWRGRGGSCDRDHQYYTSVKITKSGPLSLAVLDLDYADNRGDVEVLVLRD